MKLVTFLSAGAPRLGALLGSPGQEAIADLNGLDPRLPADLVTFLEMGDRALELARSVLATAPAETGLPREQARLKAPIPRPGKILCIGLNYRDHAQEANLPVPEVPTVFGKYPNSVVGPGEAIIIPAVTQAVDYEAELALVIGRRARQVSRQYALDYVAGFMPFNDVSARDYQFRTSQWTLGKAFDTFAPMGPALVTRDEVPDPDALPIRLCIGDETLQASNTENLIFPVAEIVAYLSQVMTLEPGDVIATGTPAGVGFSRQPRRYLLPGETVRVEIDGVGVLENPVIAADTAAAAEATAPA
jgi:acylpyruvate hydrolase